MPTGGPHPKYSDALRDMIENCIACGTPPLDIASHFGVSHQWVYDLRLTYEAFGTVAPPPMRVRGAPKKIDGLATEGLKDFYEEYPCAMQDEAIRFLLDEYDVRVS